MCHLADFNFFTNTNAYPVSLGVASGYGLIVKKISSSNQDKYFNQVAGEPSNRFAITDGNRSRSFFSR